MEKVRVGVVGLGVMGSYHADQLMKGDVKRAELTAVCDIDAKKMEPYKKKAKCFAKSEDLLRSGLVDAVIIATPHYFHTTIGIDAFGLGLHVLTEKPISVTKYDAARLIDAYKKAKKKNPDIKFCAMFNQRTDPYYQKIRQLVKSGELGKIQRTNWIITNWFRTETYYRSGGWRATWAGEGGGVLVNQCPHQLDLYQWICGMPCAVVAVGGLGRYHDIEVEDDCSALLEYADGATGCFITTTGEAPGTNRFEIAGTRGRLVLDTLPEGRKLSFLRNVEDSYEVIKNSKYGSTAPEAWDVIIPIKGGYGGAHLQIKQDFVDAILDGKELLTPGEEGINGVELANAMQLSLMTKTRVELPMDAAAYNKYLKNLAKKSTFVKKEVVENKGDFASTSTK
ncbi:MAG: Gfo/Idh/MocA family oxidoreductase [Victivallales bacterium]|nr:Gfo/Idh/MocA family oxidoreductase [Victivallales bacterium]